MKHDDVHFDNYSPQTRTKHAILTRYLPAFLNALKHQVDYYHYIDGFAGRGQYADQFPGSPLLVLDRIAEAALAGRTTLSLVESKPEFCVELQQHLSGHRTTRWLAQAPFVRSGQFTDHLADILGRPIYDGRYKTATFAFVDPCGVDGVTMADLAQLLDLPYAEVLLFFNYDAVNRLIGAYQREGHEPRALVSLFGSRELVDQLVSTLGQHAAGDKESVIREQFLSCMRRQTRAKYFVPFRFQAKDARRTSHYLVHCSSNWLPFRLMKSVMWKAGQEVSDPYGRLEFLTDAERIGQFALFRPEINELKQSVLRELRLGARSVSVFLDDWVNREDDAFSEEVYRQALLDLEKDNAISVYDKTNTAPKPRDMRMREGSPTLGKELMLRQGGGQLELNFGP